MKDYKSNKRLKKLSDRIDRLTMRIYNMEYYNRQRRLKKDTHKKVVEYMNKITSLKRYIQRNTKLMKQFLKVWNNVCNKKTAKRRHVITLSKVERAKLFRILRTDGRFK